jgi:hypothetical protein
MSSRCSLNILDDRSERERNYCWLSLGTSFVRPTAQQRN